MVKYDYWNAPVSNNITVEKFQVQPLEVRHPAVDELLADECYSSESKVIWAGVIAIYLICLYHHSPAFDHGIETWATFLARYAVIGAVTLYITAQILSEYDTWKALKEVYAQRKKHAALEAANTAQHAMDALHKLHKHNGYNKARVFRLEKSSKQLIEAFKARRFLSFEREFQILIKEYRQVINRLVKFDELEKEYEDMLKNRKRYPGPAKEFPTPPEFPLFEVLRIRKDFDELIGMVDCDPSFATIIIILKSTDRQLDPAIILKKLKKKERTGSGHAAAGSGLDSLLF